MAASKQDIREWLQRGKDKGYSHMLVVCDTFDWDDFPVYLEEGDDIKALRTEYSKNMHKVMEIYNYSLNLEVQLKERRAWHE